MSADEDDAARNVLRSALEHWSGNAGLLAEQARLELEASNPRYKRLLGAYEFSAVELSGAVKAELFCAALPFAREASTLEPDNLEYKLLLLKSLMYAGSLRIAITANAPTEGLRGKIEIIQRASLLEAKMIFEELEKKSQQMSQELYSVCSRVLDALDRAGEPMTKERTSLCERAVAMYPSSAWLIRELADALARDGQSAKALAQLRASFNIEAPNEWAIQKLKEILKETAGAAKIMEELSQLIQRFPGAPVFSKLTSLDSYKPDKKIQAGMPTLRIQNGHSVDIMSIAFSSDGKLIATGGGQSPGQIIDGTIILWERSTGRLIRNFEGHDGGVVSVAFGQHDKTLLSSGRDQSIKLWDVENGRLIWEIDNLCCVGAASFSRDGKIIISAGAKLWDTETGRLLKGPITGEQVAIDPDGKKVASNNGDIISLWNVETGRLIQTLGSVKYDVNSIAFSPDGSKVAVGCGRYEQNEIYIWEVRTGQMIQRIEKHAKAVEGVAFSSDSKALASFSRDYTVKLWEVASGRMLWTHEADIIWGTPIAFSPKENLIAVGSNHTIELLDVKTGKLRASIQGSVESTSKGPFQSYKAAISPDGSFIVSGGAGRPIEIWDNSSGQLSRPFKEGGFFKISPDSKSIAIASDRRIKLYEVNTWKAKVLQEAPSTILHIAISSNGQKIASGNIDGNIYVWDRTTGTLKASLGGHVGQTNTLDETTPSSLAFSPNGRFIVSSDYGLHVRLWDLETGKVVWPIKTPIKSALFIPDDKGLEPALIRPVSFSNVSATRAAVAFEMYSNPTTVLAFSPDGKLVAKGVGYPKNNNDNPLFILDAQTGRVLKTLIGHRAGVNSVEFSPNSKFLISASRDNTLKVWDTKSGQVAQTLKGHADDVGSVSIDKEGKFIVSASDDSTVKIWPGKDIISPSTRSDYPVSSPAIDKPISEIYTLITFKDGNWTVAGSDGRFDTNNLEEVRGLHWIFPDKPVEPLPLEIFMRDYYEPRLLPRLLDGDKFNPIRPLASLNRAQPTVRITRIQQHQGQPELLSVTVEASEGEYQSPQGSTQKSGIYDLRLFRDRQLVEYEPKSGANIQAYSQLGKQASFDDELKVWRNITQLRPDPQSGYTRTFTVKLPKNSDLTKVELSAYSFNDDRVKSETYRETCKLPQPLKASAKGKVYLITIGVAASEDPRWNLFYPTNDARRVQKDLYDRLSRQYDQVVRVPLVSDYGGIAKRAGDCIEKKPTKEAIRTALDLLAGRNVAPERRQLVPCADQIQKACPEDLVLISFSGHGFGDSQGNYYLFPYDTGKLSLDQQITDKLPDELLNRLISIEELSAWMRDIDAGEFVMILDACQSEAATGKEFKPGPMGSRGLGQLAYDKGMRMIVATQADNQAVGSGLLRNGLLTYALLEELESKVSVEEWLERAAEKVPKLYEEKLPNEIKKRGKPQQPSVFHFIRRREAPVLSIGN